MQWSKGTAAAAFDPANRRGRNVPYSQIPFKPVVGVSRQALDGDMGTPPRSGYEDDGGAVSGNFQLTVPIVNLPGRGLDLNLVMTYSSSSWSSIGGQRVFNPDGDWPAPGWYLGFGKLNPWILIDSDGTRHPIQQVDATHRRTSDGTRIDIEDEPCSTGPCQSKVRYPDGRLIEFTAATIYVFADRFPTKIIDRNGNFITISYRPRSYSFPVDEALSSIVDTVGRRINFIYDQNQNLIAIKGPTVLGANQELVRFHYLYAGQYSIGPHHTHDGVGYLIDAIYYPATKSGFWLGGAKDHYEGSYAMAGCYGKDGLLQVVNWQVGMSIQGASNTDQGKVRLGTTTRTRWYGYTSDASVAVPQISKITETWTAGPSSPVVTKIEIKHDGQFREVTITYPDGSQNMQTADESAGRIDSGLVYLSTVKSPGGQMLSAQITSWEAGADNTPRVHSVWTQNVNGAATTTVFGYGPKDEIETVSNYGFDGSLVRRTSITYVTDPQYEAQHLFNLVKQIEIFDGDAVNPTSRTDFAYDETSLEKAAGVGQHLREFDPLQAPPASYQHTVRGNLTSITTYADAINGKGATTVRKHYDISGNVVSVSQWAGAEKRYNYSLGTQYSLPDSIITGSSDPASNIRMTEQYTYNMNVGRPLTYSDPNGVKTTFTHCPCGSLQQIDLQGGPLTIFTPDYVKLQRVRETRDRAGAVITRSLSQLDGRGQVIRVEQLSNNGVNDVQQFKYDFTGQRIGETLPYAANANDLQWITYSYDALGRLTAKTTPDGSVDHRFYDETRRPSVADGRLGSTVRTEDAWGRERWWLLDSMGQVVEVVEPDPQNTGSLLVGNGFLTKYSYDILGNLIRVEQGDQTREFSFDSLSRLLAQSVPEQTPTLTDTGEYTTNIALRKWSEARSYDERTGKLASITDARGIRKLISYGTDPLGRAQTISYVDTRRPEGLGNNQPIRPYTIIPVQATSLLYASSGDLSRVTHIGAGNPVSKSFAYDPVGRIKSVSTAIDSSLLPGLTTSGSNGGIGHLHTEINSSLSMITFYAYDDAGRVKTVGESEVPPFSDFLAVFHAINSPPSNSITYRFGSGGQVASEDFQILHWSSPINFGESWTMSDIKYDPSGRVLSRKFKYYEWGDLFGTGFNETFDYYGNNLLERRHAITPLWSGYLNEVDFPLFDTSYGYTRSAEGPGRAMPTTLTPQVAQLTSQTDSLRSDGNQEFSYDLLGRLHEATLGISRGAPGGSYESLQTYSYDRYGNRIGVNAAAPPNSCGQPTCSLGVDRSDGWAQLSVDPSTNRVIQTGVVYDEAGNILAGPTFDGRTQKYQYDQAGRLVTVSDEAGKLIENYAYGLDRRRILTLDSNGKATVYGWDAQTVIAEYDVASGAHVFHVREPGGTLVSFLDDEQGKRTVEYEVPDHDAVRLVISWDNKRSHAVTFFSSALNDRPFGIDPAGSGTFGEHFSYYQRSPATGLDYALNRFYDPGSGRFLQPDPLGIGAAVIDARIGVGVRGSVFANPQRLNLYAYVTNDPINNIDPTGLLQDNRGCGYYPGDTWGLGGCVSAAPSVGYAAIGDTSPSGTGWGGPVDFRFRLASNVVFGEDVTAAQRELILQALIRIEATQAGQTLTDALGTDQISIGRYTDPTEEEYSNASGDAATREIMLGFPFNVEDTYTTATGEYTYTLERVLAHELGHLTGLHDEGTPDRMTNVNVWENPIMRQVSQWQPDRTEY